MKKEIVNYKKHPPVINITKTTMDILLVQEKPDQLIALYLFYCYTSNWQETLQIKSTTGYTAKGLKWSAPKVSRVKKRLMELKLIKNIQSRNEKHITGHYIRVYYATHSETVGVAKHGGKCLDIINNKCLDTNTRNKVGESKNVFDVRMSKKLQKIILTKKNINLNITQWPNVFRLLRTKNKVSKERIRTVIKWYANNIGDTYTPVAHSAKSFREKFSRLEEAMNRQDKKDNNGVKIKTKQTGRFTETEIDYGD